MAPAPPPEASRSPRGRMLGTTRHKLSCFSRLAFEPLRDLPVTPEFPRDLRAQPRQERHTVRGTAAVSRFLAEPRSPKTQEDLHTLGQPRAPDRVGSGGVSGIALAWVFPGRRPGLA